MMIVQVYKSLPQQQVLARVSPPCAPDVFLSVPHRIAVFSVTVLHDERIVIVAEQRPDSTEEDSFQWMSRVLQVTPPCHCSSLFLSVFQLPLFMVRVMAWLHVHGTPFSLCSMWSEVTSGIPEAK